MTISRSSSPDAGFSILEVLVALAIASTAIIAIGQLYRLTAEARGRAEEAGKVEAALFDLEGLIHLASSDVGRRIEAPDDNGVDMIKVGDSPPTVERWHLGLESNGAGHRQIDLTRGGKQTIVDLSVFESATLEYWVVSRQTSSWVSAEVVGAALPSAVRLRIELGGRVWRPLLWAVDALDPVNA